MTDPLTWAIAELERRRIEGEPPPPPFGRCKIRKARSIRRVAAGLSRSQVQFYLAQAMRLESQEAA